MANEIVKGRKKMANEDIRMIARANYIPQWKIADKLGITDITLCRWLRHDLSEEKKKQIIQAIEEIICEKSRI